MKFLLFVFALLLKLHIVFSQEIEFLYIENGNNKSQSIYIDQPNSAYHGQLSYYSFYGLDSLLNLKDSINSFTRWNEVFQYENKFFLYKPCDFLFYRFGLFNDSLFVIGSEYDFTYYKIKRISSSPKCDEYSIRNYSNYKLKIYNLNRESGLRLFEIITENELKEYFLLIEENYVNSIPIIVNKCDNHKQREYQFESPNYEFLMRDLK